MELMLKPKALMLITALCLVASNSTAYDDNTERRITIGFRLFRTLLASDTDIERKIDLNKRLNVVLVTSEETTNKQIYIEKFNNTGHGEKGIIQGYQIAVKVATPSRLPTFDFPVAGIYIIDHLSEDQLRSTISFGISHSTIIYSPFEGDVEEGVLAGIAVGIQVLPLINRQTLEKSQIALKPLFLKVAKIHED